MKDQCVCITGSTHGIGFGIAEAFAKKGAKIVINSHEKDNGALDKLKKLSECYFVQSDLSTIDGNKKLIQEAKVKLGKIDTLINNAGTFQDTDFENINDEPSRRQQKCEGTPRKKFTGRRKHNKNGKHNKQKY